MKLNKNSKVRAVGLSSFFVLLALLSTAVFCPTASESASAATRGTLKLDFVLRQALKELSIDFWLKSSGGIDYDKIAKELGIDFALSSSLTISMDNIANVSGSKTTSQPVQGATFFSGSTSFNVESSASNGFSVYVYGKDGKTAMTGTATDNTATIPALSGTGGINTAGNWWGYDLDLSSAVASDATTITYSGVAASKGKAAYVSPNGTKKNLKLTFGTKVDMATLTPDTYSGTVNVHAVPGAEQATMQTYTLRQVERVANEILEEQAAERGITVEELVEEVRQAKLAQEAEQEEL